LRVAKSAKTPAGGVLPVTEKLQVKLLQKRSLKKNIRGGVSILKKVGGPLPSKKATSHDHRGVKHGGKVLPSSQGVY